MAHLLREGLVPVHDENAAVRATDPHNNYLRPDAPTELIVAAGTMNGKPALLLTLRSDGTTLTVITNKQMALSWAKKLETVASQLSDSGLITGNSLNGPGGGV
jgi:hypothetical protein